ncbi:MAG: nucleotidyltransferase domain-containing protein [Acidobacteriota bacterium]
MTAVRFLLRLPTPLHRQLTARASAHGLSLNEYCVRKLAGPEPTGIADPSAQLIRARAEAVAGTRLVGILVHGSWVRGEARSTSDVDVLVVVESALALTRALYRAWDAEPLLWEGRAVDAHFVHLPKDPARAGAVWCEAAVEGVLLHDRDGRVERALRRLRRAIADGHLVRKRAHGQPYWTTAA